MSLINRRLVSQYELQLERMQEALSGHDRATANLLKTWREELRSASDQAALKAHVARTARSMGGMGSIGEVVMIGNNPEELRLLEELYAICKFILSSE
jgi:hypothetical protein